MVHSSSFKKTIIIAFKKECKRILNSVSKLLTEYGLEVLAEPKLGFLDEFLVKEADFIITIGGDGTILQVSYIASPKPILPVAYQSFGGLAEISIDELEDAIDRIAKGAFRIEESLRIEAVASKSSGFEHFGDVLNEFVIVPQKYGRLFSAEISINGHSLTTFRGDGLIIATPLGSTGHFYSVSFAVVGVDAISIAPIAPLRVKFPTLILPANVKITIRVLCDSVLVADGFRNFPISHDTCITFEKSERVSRFIRVKDEGFRIRKFVKAVTSVT